MPVKIVSKQDCDRVPYQHAEDNNAGESEQCWYPSEVSEDGEAKEGHRIA